MAFSFTPTYQDYLTQFNQQYGNASEGGAASPLSQSVWDTLGASGQWNLLGNGLALQSNDPRYAAIAQQLGLTNSGPGYNPANTIQIGYGSPDMASYTNPNQVLQGDGVFASNHGNLTPYAQRENTGGLSDRGWGLAVASLFGGGMLAGALSGGASPLSGLVGPGASGGAGGGSIVGNAGDASYAGAFDSSGFSGTALDPTVAGGAGSSSSSFLSQLNSGRQYLNGARMLGSLLSGGGSGSSGGSGGGMDLSSLLSSLFGSGSSGGGLGGLLGLIAAGHQAFGNGVGTPAGAQQTAQQASQLADPWGSSGHRSAFSSLLTPDKVMGLLSQDPSQVLNNPAYQFDLNQGVNAINMGDAAQGTLRSGNRGYELEQFGQGLASKYGQQFFNNNLSTLSALSGLAGVNAGSPVAAGQMLMGGFDNASNLRNAGINGLFSGGAGNPLIGASGNNILSLLSQGGSSLWSALTGGSGLSSSDISSLIGSTPDSTASNDLFNSLMSGYGNDAANDAGISSDLFNSFVGGW